MSKLFLVGDVGGTNTNLALARQDESGIELVEKAQFSTKNEKSLLDPIKRFLESRRVRESYDKIDLCCISGAGPVQLLKYNKGLFSRIKARARILR